MAVFVTFFTDVTLTCDADANSLIVVWKKAVGFELTDLAQVAIDSPTYVIQKFDKGQ